MKTCSTERTQWRDLALSKRHRQWGFNCPAVDLDFMMVEYNHGKPCAIVEYKHQNAKAINTGHATYRALIALADGYRHGPLPCFIAIYEREEWSFIVVPLNDAAREYYAHCEGARISERRFVESLYLMRRDVLTAEDKIEIAKLNDLAPVAESCMM